MNIIAKIKSLGRKRLLIIAAAIVVIITGILWYFISDKSPLTDEQKAENKTILDIMNNSRVTGGVDSTRLANIEASKKAGKYADALQQLNTILAEPNLAENDKRTLYSILLSVCLPLQDFACVDKVTAEFGKLLPFDYFFLVDAARLATAAKQPAKAKAYYSTALAELDKQGGQSYVTKLNETSEVSLDYAEIKRGAGQ